MFTKPCRGCDGLCRAKTRSKLAERNHCSRPCYYAYMRRLGLPIVPGLTKAQRQAASRKGGVAGNASRQRAAMQRRVEEAERLLPESILAKLPHHDQVRLKALFARVYEQGRDVGIRYQGVRRFRAKQAQKVTEAA